MKKYVFLLLCACFLDVCSSFADDNDTAPLLDRQQASEIHAKPWAFGQSAGRNEKIWKKGIDSDVFFKKRPQDRMAILDGKAAARNEAEKNRHRKMGISFKDESGAWKVAPQRKDLRPDESRVRDNRHVLSAFANVEATDDLSFRMGPELILRDDTKGEEAARNDQPDSVFGLGMNFKYDF